MGWVQNTYQSTVIGSAQGTVNHLASFTYFLEKIGSPHSSIDKLELKNCRLIEKLEFSDFRVNKSYANVKTTETDEQESSTSKEIELELRELGKLKFESKNK